jgi:hypothetical protein
MKLSNSQLEAAMRSLARANNRAKVARDKIMAHCNEVYGVEPGDVDNDLFIDSVDGACGECQAMTAEAFDESMRHCMELCKVAPPVKAG